MPERRVLLGGVIVLIALTLIAVIFAYVPNIAKRRQNRGRSRPSWTAISETPGR